MTKLNSSEITILIEELYGYILGKSPENIRLFEVFAQESVFAREWLDNSLKGLNQQDEILEVGAGLMILSCQLVREGYSVTALEPIAEGFSAFSRLQAIILEYAQTHGFAPKVLACSVEHLNESMRYRFAYSVNVMEHIANVELGIKQVTYALKDGASYRFTCPNYLFPYEPHFNIPTIFSKSLTERVFRKRIFESKQVSEPEALWASLNWINALQIKKIVGNLPNVKLVFNRDMLSSSFERINSDSEFASRRSSWLRKIITMVVYFKLHHILKMLPVEVSPILDCSLRKN